MMLPAHLSGGYIAVNLVDKLYPGLGIGSSGLLVTTMIGSVLPDVDFVFSKYIKDHHSTWPHSPLLWIAVYTLVFSIGIIFKNQLVRNYSTALIIGIFIHLFLDWFNARTAGIRIFYPFSERLYSLFPVQPHKGEVPIFPFLSKEYIEFFKFYSQNKFLLFSEIGVTVSGFILFIFNILKSKTI